MSQCQIFVMVFKDGHRFHHLSPITELEKGAKDAPCEREAERTWRGLRVCLPHYRMFKKVSQ